MTYTYAYKTSDGVRHEATREASSREEVFAALRREGIKPIKVVAADGSKANGEVRGIRRRLFWSVVLAAVVITSGVSLKAYYTIRAERRLLAEATAFPLASPRHQIYGDPDLVGAFEAGRFESVFANPGDRLLAWYAQPGKVMCPKGTPARALFDLSGGSRSCATDLESALASDVAISDSDSREVRELKQIVNGLKAELRAYLANGNGTPASYWRRLYERYRQERQIFERIERELENETDAAVWEEKNEALRRLGLRTIPNPHEAE